MLKLLTKIDSRKNQVNQVLLNCFSYPPFTDSWHAWTLLKAFCSSNCHGFRDFGILQIIELQRDKRPGLMTVFLVSWFCWIICTLVISHFNRRVSFGYSSLMFPCPNIFRNLLQMYLCALEQMVSKWKSISLIRGVPYEPTRISRCMPDTPM